MGVERALLRKVTRRSVVGGLAGASIVSLLAACRRSRIDDDESEDDLDLEESEQSDDESDEDSETPDGEDDTSETNPAPDGPEQENEETEVDETESTDSEPDSPDASDVDAGEANATIGDVLEFQLTSGDGQGSVGSVTLRLHEGRVENQTITFIRTAASDAEFAGHEGLSYVPRLTGALDAPGSTGELYLFAHGPVGQLPVMSMSPADGERYSPAFRVNHVLIVGKTGVPLTSETEILAAAEIGNVEIESTDIIVNYPHVTWPGGQLSVDDALTDAFGGGQLLEQPAAGTATFKLHQGYPDCWYIVTAASDSDVAESAGIATSEVSHLLADAGAASSITAFRDGIAGAGAYGFQPAVFAASSTDEAASPFCEYSSVEWSDTAKALEVTSFAQLDELIESGELVRSGGGTDSDPGTYVANCPVVVTGQMS